VPVGYIGRTDDPAKSIAGVTYTPAPGGMWEVNSGTHDQNLSHIVYTPLDTATGTYAVRTEMDQIQTAVHPEAFGVFIGGRNLDGPAQKYGYFLLRSDGMYAIKVRDGREARVLVDFTASPHVAKANAAGQANYPITVRVATDSVRLFVGPDPVAAIARGRIPADGIVGLRVNHGLRLTVSPIVISR